MNPWVRPMPRPEARLRLFCFPYSGAGALAFRSWQQLFPAEIDVCPVQLPGRENRFREAPFTRMDALVEAATDGITPYLDLPFALYGHSLGSLVAFEVARKLRSWGMPQPVHLLVSGCHAPQVQRTSPPLYQLSDADFLVEVERFGGTSQEVLRHAELMKLVLPILRADLTIYDTYEYISSPALDCPLSAYGGLQDTRATQQDMATWQAQTNSAFALSMFPGGHFFLQTAQDAFLATLAQALLPHTQASEDADAPRSPRNQPV